MEVLFTCGLALLEITFIFVALLVLHGLRKVIGSASFYIAIGLLLVFTQIVSAVELKIILGYPGADFYISSTILFLPYLAALMIVYVTEGTLATQRLIIGVMASLGIYIYISHITVTQCDWPGYSISQGTSADLMNYLLRQSQRTMSAATLSQTLDLFLIPIFFQRLRNLQCRLFFCVLGALMLTQLVDTFVYVSACYWGQAEWWLYLNSSYIAKAVATIWLSILATLYISRIDEEIPGEGRSPMDIVFAFFGGYGKAQALQKNLREWEGRYSMVVENASDMILLLDTEGKILDANLAALRVLRLGGRKELIGQNFSKMIYGEDGKPVEWELYYKSFRVEDTTEGPHIQRLQCYAFSSSTKINLDMAISSIYIEGMSMLIVFGRDVTEEKKLAMEKDDLSMKLSHAQRLESVGKLAGGVAHDFNNYIHAIQGHVDVITYMYNVEDEDVLRHLEKINEITEMASQLTQQLLGFARKGQYVKKVLELGDLVRRSAQLFMPKSQEGLDFNLDIADEKMPVVGDAVQLQQVLLNLLINARDALESKEKSDRYIYISVDRANAFDALPWKPPDGKNVRRRDFYCIRIEDNGMGIGSDIINRIFEPFFTTKPIGKGSGMGLAMVYGTISNHKGWVHVESQKEIGTTFYIILPRCTDADSAENT